MENLGEVKSLTQQCNGNGNTPPSEDNNNPQPVTPEQTRTQGGGVLSSTPQRAAGGRTVPPPEESPVVSQRYCGPTLSGASGGALGESDHASCVLSVGRSTKEANRATLPARCLEIKR